MRRPLLLEVIQKLLAEESDRSEGHRRTENESSDDVEQFHFSPSSPALSRFKSAARENSVQPSDPAASTVLQALETKLAIEQREILTDRLEIRDFWPRRPPRLRRTMADRPLAMTATQGGPASQSHQNFVKISWPQLTNVTSEA
jgi:hypothetical protein